MNNAICFSKTVIDTIYNDDNNNKFQEGEGLKEEKRKTSQHNCHNISDFKSRVNQSSSDAIIFIKSAHDTTSSQEAALGQHQKKKKTNLDCIK